MPGIENAIKAIEASSAIHCTHCNAFVFDERQITWDSKETAFLCPKCLKEFIWKNPDYLALQATYWPTAKTLFNFYAVNHKPNDNCFVERVEIESLAALKEYHERLCSLWKTGVNIFEAGTGEQFFF